MIDTDMVKYTLIIYSKKWDERKNEENNNYFNICKFMEYLKDKPKGIHNKKLILKEILIKIFITFLFNGPQNFNDETIAKLYDLYMPNYNDIYDESNIDSIQNDKVKISLEKMLNVIDSGMDKTVIGFSKEINLLSKKIISTALSSR